MSLTGFRFSPTDEELIQILDRKVSGQAELALYFIVEKNLYEHEPQDLEWDHTVAVNNNERFYYSKRENDSRIVSGRGWWRATGHVITIRIDECLMGYKRPLTFHRFKDQNENRKDAIKTKWIMHEYSLGMKTSEWRLCKIKYKGKLQEEMKINIRNNLALKNDSEAAGSSKSMQLELVGDDEQQQQPQPLEQVDSIVPMPLDDVYEPYCSLQYMPLEMVEYDHHPHDHDQQPQPFHDPFLTMLITTGQYYFNEQQQPHEPAYPSLWSWNQ